MQFGLAAGQHLAHRLDARRRLHLQPRQLCDLIAGLFVVAPSHGTRRDDCDRGERRNSRDEHKDSKTEVNEIVSHGNF